MRDRNGGLFNPDLTNETIPTLGDALSFARGQIYLDLDVKNLNDIPLVASFVAQQNAQSEVDVKIEVMNQSQADYADELQAVYGLLVMPKTGFNANNVDEMISLLSNLRTPVVESITDDGYDLQTLLDHETAFRYLNHRRCVT